MFFVVFLFFKVYIRPLKTKVTFISVSIFRPTGTVTEFRSDINIYWSGNRLTAIMWHQYLQVTRCDFLGYIYTRFYFIIVNPILFDKDFIRRELYSFNVVFVYRVNNHTIQIYKMIIENGSVGVIYYILSQHTSGDLNGIQWWDHTIIALCYIYIRVMDISTDINCKVKLFVFISLEVNK